MIFGISKNNRGYMIIVMIILTTVFLTILISTAGYVRLQKKAQRIKQNREQALQISEAGLDYYRWFLAHFPDDLQDGTGGPGPYVHPYNDPEGGPIGQFSLEISGNKQCGVIQSVEITSTGNTLDEPSYTRVTQGKYTRPTVGQYSYVLNSNVWAGSDRVIVGPYHSNGGIRMDGTNNSTVTSGLTN